VQRIPLLNRNVLETENSVEGKDKSVVRPKESKTVQLLRAIVANVALCTVAK